MPNAIDLSGQRYGRLVAIRRGEPTPHGATRWICQCDCGKVTLSLSAALKRGAAQSCGCMRDEATSIRMKAGARHGLTNHRVHHSWSQMKARCGNPSRADYPRYGGRGITYCDRWKSFDAFLEDMGLPPSPIHTLDRINNAGNYEPGNCRWATPVEQASNRRNNTLLTINGETKTLSQWSRISGVSKPTICVRLYNLGWPPERAVFEAVKYGRHPRHLEITG